MGEQGNVLHICSVGFGGQCDFVGANVQLDNDSDQSFSLLSLDITGFQPDTIAYTDVYMVGYQSGGGSVTRDLNSVLLDCDDCAAGPLNWSTLSFGAEWTDLTHVIFYTDTAELWVDNVVLTTVPVPAAAWLFGSALMGLGWLRRKAASPLS